MTNAVQEVDWSAITTRMDKRERDLKDALTLGQYERAKRLILWQIEDLWSLDQWLAQAERAKVAQRGLMDAHSRT